MIETADEPKSFESEGDFCCLMRTDAVCSGLVYGKIVARPGARPDFRRIESNAYFDKLVSKRVQVEGGSELERWLGVSPEMLEMCAPNALGRWDMNNPLEVDVWLPRAGKTMHIIFCMLHDNHFLATVHDVTQNRNHESEVLKSAEKLRRFENQFEETTKVITEEWQQVLYSTVLNLQPFLDGLKNGVSNETGLLFSGKLQHVITSLLQYSMTNQLDRHCSLVSVENIAQEAISEVSSIYSAISFKAGPLPKLIASKDMLHAIIKNVLSFMCSYSGNEGDITLEYCSECFEPSFKVSSSNFKFHNELSLEYMADLSLFVFRKLVVQHGGQFSFQEKWPDCLSITFSLGTPLKLAPSLT